MKDIHVLIKKLPYVFALLVVSIAGLVSYVLDAWFLPTQGTLLILQLAVVITALPGHKKGAIFAGFLSGLTFNYFFTTPRFSLHMSDVDDIVNLLIFLIVAVITSYLAAFYRTQREALELAELRASILMSVSHDLRTPLSTIIGTLSTMQEYQHRLPKSQNEELLQGALDESHRLHRYIENLLQATRLQHGIKLNGTIQSILPIIKTVVNRFNSERIRVIQRAELPPIYASAYLLEQAIYNVIDNALKYSPVGSPVTVISSADEQGIDIDILDEGPGINAKHKELIFDLFYSTRKGDAGEGGSGIGLTVAKGIVEAHNGRISVLSGTQGCTIRLSLPLGKVS